MSISTSSTTGQRPTLRQNITLAGAVCSLLIGSGFATGQEALQYFAAHGWWGIAGVLLVTAIFLWMISTLLEWGRKNPERLHDAFVDFCGKYIGTGLKYLVPFFLFAVVVTMIAGAGALLNESYGLPIWAGSTIIAVMIGATLLVGLKRLVDILGSLGPVIIVLLVLIGIAVLLTNLDGLGAASTAVQELQPPKAMDNWALGALLYAVSIMLMCVPFLASLGATASMQRTTLPGSMLGTLAVGAVLLVMTLALLAAMPLAFNKATPLVSLGSSISPIIGVLFAIVTFLGIYSTAAPLIWSVADQFSAKSARNYKLISVGLTALALVGGATLPFGTLVGLIYPFAGYFGLFLMACIAYRQIKNKFTNR
ncbi:hypothetical protein [Arthrobacter sp. MYb213]|uniref:YkvI family membrane protein n=1 Tax=Arthrobacter sp. MYb213 TaxID=1848595 RepID=UPI000CFB1FC6|nr:hypothetical protein [Arthrobacter sp. MYb213]PRB66773.1 hypothetical protein CQ011_17135 [Arthrobacter sp. MYb213]